MSQQTIVIVNTGCANISSVKFALERLGVAVTVSDDPAVIKAADKVFLPGVGSAGALGAGTLGGMGGEAAQRCPFCTVMQLCTISSHAQREK